MYYKSTIDNQPSDVYFLIVSVYHHPAPAQEVIGG